MPDDAIASRALASAESDRDLKPKEAVTLFTGAFKDFSTGMVSSMKEIHGLAKDRATTFLYSLGTVVLILALFLRLRPFGVTLSEMQPAEFITISILAVILILTATLLRVYEAWVTRDAIRTLGTTGGGVLEKTQDTGLKLLERAQEQAIKMVDKATDTEPKL